jgi:predicted TIM-barrel fold metal-dependent hydrolase
MNSPAEMSPLAVKSPFGGRKVVDIDTHYSEPRDLWTKRAPAKYKDRVPQIATIDGQIWWVMDGRSMGMGGEGTSAIRKDGYKAPGADCLELAFKDIHPGCTDPTARVALMDTCGVTAQILYANVMGFGSKAANKADPELRLLSTKIYNDAMAELQEESGQRIFPMALLPWWDCKAMVEETLRAHEMGLRGVNINPEPFDFQDANGAFLPDLGHSHWNPFWEVVQSLDIPVNFHIGATTIGSATGHAWQSLPQRAQYKVMGYASYFGNARTCANLVFSGLFDRYPKLKLVSVESGLGWVPFSMEYWDYMAAEGKFEKEFHMERRPSEYMKSNIYTSFWFERKNVARDVKMVGVDNVMFETDFPHPQCLWPLDDVASAFAGLEEAEIAKVLSGNAIRLYKLPV